MNDRLLRACRREPVDATPIWMMRQAGRSLPAYRVIRERYGFLDLVKNADLMAEVTMLPMREMDLDGAVIFADIMLPMASLGVGFDIVEGIGPVVGEPIRTRTQVEHLTSVPVTDSVPTVFDTIRLVRKELGDHVPVIGFSGAPFTLASYLIEGRPTRDFAWCKAMMFSEPSTWHLLLDRITSMVIEYLREQIEAGAQVIQLFDSWVGALAPQDMRAFVLPYSKQVFDALADTGVPRIHFGTNTGALLEMMSEAGPDVVGVDWRVPLDEAWRRIGGRGIQGNLEPAVLLGPPDVVADRATDVLERAGGRPGHVFNLGHGVPAGAPLDNLKLLVDVVHSFQT